MSVSGCVMCEHLGMKRSKNLVQTHEAKEFVKFGERSS